MNHNTSETRYRLKGLKSNLSEEELDDIGNFAAFINTMQKYNDSKIKTVHLTNDEFHRCHLANGGTVSYKEDGSIMYYITCNPIPSRMTMKEIFDSITK